MTSSCSLCWTNGFNHFILSNDDVDTGSQEKSPIQFTRNRVKPKSTNRARLGTDPFCLA